MPIQIWVAIIVEVLLIASSLVLLLQPEESRGSKTAGWAVLSLTFCWSVVLGCMLTLNRYFLES